MVRMRMPTHAHISQSVHISMHAHAHTHIHTESMHTHLKQSLLTCIQAPMHIPSRRRIFTPSHGYTGVHLRQSQPWLPLHPQHLAAPLLPFPLLCLRLVLPLHSPSTPPLLLPLLLFLSLLLPSRSRCQCLRMRAHTVSHASTPTRTPASLPSHTLARTCAPCLIATRQP